MCSNVVPLRQCPRIKIGGRLRLLRDARDPAVARSTTASPEFRTLANEVAATRLQYRRSIVGLSRNSFSHIPTVRPHQIGKACDDEESDKDAAP